MKKLIAVASATFILLSACQKGKDAKQNPEANSAAPSAVSPNSHAGKDPGSIGGNGGVVAPAVTYLSKSGNSYSGVYAGIPITLGFVSLSSSTTPTIWFRKVDCFNGTGAYATQPSSPNSNVLQITASGDVLTLVERYCASTTADSSGLTGICTTWSSRSLSARIVKVLNPPAGGSNVALVPISMILGQSCTLRVD